MNVGNFSAWLHAREVYKSKRLRRERFDRENKYKKTSHNHSVVKNKKKVIKKGSKLDSSSLNHVTVDTDLKAISLLLQCFGQHELSHPVDALITALDGKVVSLASAVNTFG